MSSKKSLKFLTSSLRAIFEYRHLLKQLVIRDISGRYKGSIFGKAWAFFYPLMNLCLYGIVFGIILKPRWPNVEDPIQFSLILFTGLLVFNFFSECITRSPSLIISNANYVKKVVFPIEILPLVSIGSALFHMLLGFLAWVIISFYFGAKFTLCILYFPLIIAPLILLTAGISWFLAAVGVFIRDINQVLSLMVQCFLYLGPILYPREVLPENIRWFMLLNPITIPVEQLHNLLNFGIHPDFLSLTEYGLFSVIICILGRIFFDLTKRDFADVI